MICRNCGHDEFTLFCDLGSQPLANSFLTRDQVKHEPETFYPLRPKTCTECGLVQLPEQPQVVFDQSYPYRSGQSVEWEQHLVDLVTDLGISVSDSVIEVGGNDGLLGELLPSDTTYWNIDPAGDDIRLPLTSDLAAALGEGIADWVIALNVLAHVHDLDDFLEGCYRLLKPGGKLVIEVPNAFNLVHGNLFDTIYHEHLSYFESLVLYNALEWRGFHVSVGKGITTHGGSVRAVATPGVPRDLSMLSPLPPYRQRPPAMRHRLMADLRAFDGPIVGWGAPAKAAVLMNYCHITTELVQFVVDSTPEKQGKFIPGVHVPIYPESHLLEFRPKGILILAWNYEREIREKIKALPYEVEVLSLSDYRGTVAPGA